MKTIGWIRLGDLAACGGIVAEGDVRCRNMGKPYAFQGARMDCPRNCVIAEAYDQSTLTNGQRRVLHGMKTSGGCPLLSTLNDIDGITQSSAANVPVRFIQDEAGQWHGRDNEGYDQHFVPTDQQTGEPLADRFYRMRFNGKTIEGRTDSEGMTLRAFADDPSEVTIEIMPEGYCGDTE